MPDDDSGSDATWSSFDAAPALREGAGAADVFGLPWPKELSGRSGGDLGGIGTGSSIDFHDQRTYVPGDDPRHINWGAYARTGTYTMKLFREEVQPQVDVVVDTSPSMGYTEPRARRLVSLAAFVAHSARQAAAAVWFYDATPTEGSAPRRWSAEDVLSGRFPKTPGSATPTPPNIHTIPFRIRSVRVLISDLLFPGDPSQLLGPLGRSAGAASLLAPYSPGESDPDWEGGCEFLDAESPGRVSTWCDRGLVKRYRDAYRGHFSVWADAASRSQIQFARISTEDTLLNALQSEALHNGAVSARK